MSGLKKVVWAEGVFLGQQHFQAWDRYQHSSQHLKTLANNPYGWGVISLRWNAQALLDGRFEVLSLKAVMPNGIVVDYQRDHDAPLTLDLNELNLDTCQLKVSLPSSDLVEGIAGYQAAGRVSGWVAEYEDIQDDSDASRVREVMLAKPNLQLSVRGESADKQVSMPLVSLQRQYDGEYRVIADTIPPSLQLNAVPALWEITQSSRDLVTNLVREFAQARAKIGDVASYSTTELSDFLYQKDMTLLLPELQDWAEHGRAHPYQLYLQLSRLHQLCALYFTPEKMGALSPYDHDRLGEILPTLLREAREMLGQRRERVSDKAALEALSPGRFESNNMPRHVLESCSFYLAVDAKQDNVDWVNRFGQLCKLANPDQLETIVASGLPGVTLRHVQRLPQKIRIKSGFEYFQVITDGPMWDGVLQAQKFGLFCMGEFADADVELIVLDEKG